MQLLALALFTPFIIFHSISQPDWGFFAHRKINKYAVYTLPDPLFSWYKKHIEYLEIHAVDPDKRRYAVKGEAYFHYLDMDVYESELLENQPLEQLRWKYSQVTFTRGDSTVHIKRVGDPRLPELLDDSVQNAVLDVLDKLIIDNEVAYSWVHEGNKYELDLIDSFSMHGLLPFRIRSVYKQLENAFREKDVKKILRLSADLGHYIGDAHVPLHTTENYNGQLTGQDGIHAFWESRLPELLLHKKYFLSISPAEYLDDITGSVWAVINESHKNVNQVLSCEQESRSSMPQEKINCLDKRSNTYSWTQCPEYAEAFNECLGDMVWDRWERSIQFLGSIWFTAWANAGEPDLFKEDISNEYLAGEHTNAADGHQLTPTRECEQ